jgi:hypothetical protein
MAITIKKSSENNGIYIPPDTIVECISTFFKGSDAVWAGSKWRFDDEYVQSSPAHFAPVTLDDATWARFLHEHHERGRRA